MWDKVKSGDFSQQLVVGEEVADVLSDFWPEAKYAEDAMKLLGVIVALKRAGLWRDAQPEDPSMTRSAGPSPGLTPTMHGPVVTSPGGTPEDPYNFDNRPMGQ